MGFQFFAKKKKGQKNVEKYYRVSTLPNLLKGASAFKCINTSFIYSQNGYTDSIKALPHNTAFLL